MHFDSSIGLINAHAAEMTVEGLFCVLPIRKATIDTMIVPKQNNSFDCGLFALAFTKKVYISNIDQALL